MTEPRAPQSQLAPLARLCREPDPGAAFALADRLWHEHGIPAFPLAATEHRRGWAAAKRARQLAEECFGKRGGK